MWPFRPKPAEINPRAFELEARMSTLEGLHLDLLERFKRFQSRDGMRQAREVASRDKNATEALLADAEAILSQQSGVPDRVAPQQTGPFETKKALYQKMRGH